MHTPIRIQSLIKNLIAYSNVYIITNLVFLSKGSGGYMIAKKSFSEGNHEPFYLTFLSRKKIDLD